MKMISTLIYIFIFCSATQFFAMVEEGDKSKELSDAINMCDTQAVLHLAKYAEACHVYKVAAYCLAYSLDTPSFNTYMNMLKALLNNGVFRDAIEVHQLIKFGYPTKVIAFLAQHLKQTDYCIRCAKRRKRKLRLKISEQSKKLELKGSENSCKTDICNSAKIIKKKEKKLSQLKVINYIIYTLKFIRNPVAVLQHAMDHSLEIFKELLHLCAWDINSPQSTDSGELSLLMIAIKKNKVDIAQFLLEQGATINSECILSAVDSNSYQMVKILFEFGAEFNIDDEKGQ